MTPDDLTAALAWRNLVADWHLKQGMPDCGCDDDTTDGDFCDDSKTWADARFVERDDPALIGPPDAWNHDTWKAAWGRNAPMIASDIDYRLPKPPAGLAWLAKRVLVGGRCAVELVLYRLGENRLTSLAHARVDAEPTTVTARARAMLQRMAD